MVLFKLLELLGLPNVIHLEPADVLGKEGEVNLRMKSPFNGIVALLLLYFGSLFYLQMEVVLVLRLSFVVVEAFIEANLGGGLSSVDLEADLLGSATRLPISIVVLGAHVTSSALGLRILYLQDILRGVGALSGFRFESGRVKHSHDPVLHEGVRVLKVVAFELFLGKPRGSSRLSERLLHERRDLLLHLKVVHVDREPFSHELVIQDVPVSLLFLGYGGPHILLALLLGDDLHHVVLPLPIHLQLLLES